MSRYRLLLVAVVAMIVILGIGVWAVWYRTAITPESAEQIKLGMKLAELELILGGPQRDERSGRQLIRGTDELPLGWCVCRESDAPINDDAFRRWNSDFAEIVVAVNDAGRVIYCYYTPMEHEPPLEMMRRWLRL